MEETNFGDYRGAVLGSNKFRQWAATILEDAKFDFKLYKIPGHSETDAFDIKAVLTSDSLFTSQRKGTT